MVPTDRHDNTDTDVPAITSVTTPASAKYADSFSSNTYFYDLSHLAPIDRLPVELLIDIFLACTRDSTGFSFVSLTLSQVCHAWRDILFDSPRLWQSLSLDDRRSTESLEYQSFLWLRQSKGLPIDVKLQISNVDLLLPILIPLLPHIQRWGRWSVAGKVTEEVDFRTFCNGGSRAIFDDLYIVVRGATELQDLLQPGEAHRHPIFTHTQSYLKPDVHMVNVRLNVLSLPPSNTMSAVLVRNLTISESSIEVVPDLVRMLEFLQFCPCIETFHYFGFPQEPPPTYTELPVRPPIVTLHRLRVLVIRSTCAVRVILSHITAPLLSELYLEHTNMEFEPDIAPYPYDAEDGDSDDEHNDFSQSPWSDHATGMGLRSLIKRSNPPLEVLAMDYADMRTKDFEWCFDRLATLQEFRIVASDMSDKVIKMLAPFQIPGVTMVPSPLLAARPPPVVRPSLSDLLDSDNSNLSENEEDTPPSDTESTSSSASSSATSASSLALAPTSLTSEINITPHTLPLIHVRLPRLTSLELWNCQRLTGDALVHALRARAGFTDMLAQRGDGRCLPLQEVAVIGCSDFLPRHGFLLGIALGNRLRIQ